jgi:hypothetical protein
MRRMNSRLAWVMAAQATILSPEDQIEQRMESEMRDSTVPVLARKIREG